ncbi:MAG: histidine kinase [Arachidicoccus sp.]|nr:histidine kinase [Arachidicoccus sp.]
MPIKSAIKYNVLNVIFSLLVIGICLFYWLNNVLQISLHASMSDSLTSIVLLYILFLCISYIPVFKLSKKTDTLYLMVYSFALTLVWSYICRQLLTYIFGDEHNYMLMWENHFFIRSFIGWIIIYAYNIIEHFRTRILEVENEIQEKEQSTQLKKDAELFKLRQQQQPHFLFNSLNSVNALIVREPQRARQMIQQLSDYLRNNIKKEDDDFIGFREEMSDLRLYLAIEQVRFGHRLVIKEEVVSDCEDIKVPPFLFQPLVENAIKYGLYGTTGIVTIFITIKKNENELIFTIKNPYDTDAVTTKGTGFGLESVRRRLYLLFARNDLLKTENGILPKSHTEEESINIFTATIIIPLKLSDKIIL